MFYGEGVITIQNVTKGVSVIKKRRTEVHNERSWRPSVVNDEILHNFENIHEDQALHNLCPVISR